MHRRGSTSGHPGEVPALISCSVTLCDSVLLGSDPPGSLCESYAHSVHTLLLHARPWLLFSWMQLPQAVCCTAHWQLLGDMRAAFLSSMHALRGRTVQSVCAQPSQACPMPDAPWLGFHTTMSCMMCPACDVQQHHSCIQPMPACRSVGGMRASIYNAMPEEGVDKLVAFMKVQPQLLLLHAQGWFGWVARSAEKWETVAPHQLQPV